MYTLSEGTKTNGEKGKREVNEWKAGNGGGICPKFKWGHQLKNY